MSHLLLKQKLMKGRAEIGKGVEPFRKGAVSRKQRNVQKKEAGARKVSWVSISTLSWTHSTLQFMTCESVQLHSFKIRQKINTCLRKIGSIRRMPGSHGLIESQFGASQQQQTPTQLPKPHLLPSPTSPNGWAELEFPSPSQISCFLSKWAFLWLFCCLINLPYSQKFNSLNFDKSCLTPKFHGKSHLSFAEH